MSIRRAGAALNSWTSLFGFLMVQEFASRFRTTRLGPVLAVGEPILMILIIVLVRGVFRGMFPHFGTSMALFLSSGVFPYYVFVRLSVRSRVVRYEAAARLPSVTTTEALLAGTASEAALILSALVLWFACLYLVGIDGAVPVNPGDCLIALTLIAMMGIGMGLVNVAIIRRFPAWGFFYAIPSRGLIILSGCYYIVDLLPLFFRDVIVWNPIAHAIEWYRVGQYGDQYPSITLDRQFCVVSSIVLLLIGIACHRGTLRSEQKR